MAKVRFAPAIFKQADTRAPKILFGKDVAFTSNPANSNVKDIREFLNHKREKSQVSHCHCERLINVMLSCVAA